jgi:16S rRNA (cytidine1402-2'-O)-methyltransferase
MQKETPGALYLVATPIGNLEDITFRAIRTLKEVDLIAAEDTRHSRKLLSHYGIAAKMTPYHDHNEQLKTDYLLEKLNEGLNIAIITDAGTPCIADPGYRIVKAATEQGIRVVPIPGASALAAALSASGLPTDRFVFEGFLPAKSGRRKTRLADLKSEERVIVIYEAPHRLVATLTEMAEVLGERPAVVARELTKIHEEFRSGSLSELTEHFAKNPPKGEIVILLHPQEAESAPEADMEALLSSYLFEEKLSVKDASTRAAAETGRPKSELYTLALLLKADKTR